MDLDLIFKGIIALGAIFTAFGFIFGKGYFEKTWEKIAETERARKLAYETEMGKVAATKESIEMLTKTVEQVKADFIKETEKIKIELQFENHFKISFNNEIKNAILNVYSLYFVWQNKIVSIQSKGTELDEKYVNNLIEEMSKVYFDFIGARAIVELYIQDTELTEVLMKLFKISIQIHIKIQEKLTDIIPFSIQKNLMGLNELKTNPINFYKEFNNNNKEIESYIQNLASIIEKERVKLNESQKKHNDEITAMLNQLVTHTPELRNACYRLIKTTHYDNNSLNDLHLNTI